MRSILLLAVVLAGCAPASSVPAPPSSESRWTSVLHRLDERRERAYVRGDPSLLDRVYRRGSATRRADARLLRAYIRRGLELEAVPMRLRDVRLVSRGDRQVRLRVIDRLDTVRVRRAGGPWQALPDDQASEHLITLHRGDKGWRIAAIRRVAG